MKRQFPAIVDDAARDTRDALHAYARILGDCLKSSRSKRKHWWHASLRPSLVGWSTGIVHGEPDFELEINARNSQLDIRTSTGESYIEPLIGQPAYQLADVVCDFLVATGVKNDIKSHINIDRNDARYFAGFSTEYANLLGRISSDITASLLEFRSGIREETSPVQLWPHHFDLSMLWLPGDKMPDQDPDNEEYADKQMNFGFTFGDDGIPEPYFYVTAYPFPDGLSLVELPDGTHWQTEGFTGAVLTYQRLLDEADPGAYLQQLWNGLLAEGRRHLINETT